ncbi:hypothetical protein [Stutzerimonas kunmingensis]|uniref:hypothetical protein n=1 Tax=Stutzerimonas kunmingensis TaxID=1211807 RepID=UPI0028B03DDE|nr:hypothetical protein [Stutzerimonas kunmingensis]
MADDKERLILHRLRPDKSEDDAEYLEIPAFLRRQTGETDAAFEALTAQAHAAADEIFRGDRERYTDHSEKDAVGSGSESKSRAEKEAPMSDSVTRSELEAKLEAIEARMDSRIAAVSGKIDGFLAAQVERDKAQAERDKRYELLAERVTKAAEGAEDAAKQAATVKSNYWAAVGVQLLAVVAIIVGAYFANQANVLGVMQTTISAMQAGKEQVQPPPSTPQQ